MITVGFSSSDSALSWAIRKLTRSDVSHCFLIHEVLGVQCALEAVASGFRAIPMSVFAEDNRIVDIVSIDAEIPDDGPILGAMLGHPYDFLGLVGFAWVLCGRRLGRSWKNPARGASRLFCSESVMRVLSASGVAGTEGVDPEQFSPEDVLRFVRAART